MSARVYPARCRDIRQLSSLLDTVLRRLEDEPLRLSRRALGYNTGIPEIVWTKLCAVHQCPETATGVSREDFQVAFANLLFRYPTLKLWMEDDGDVIVEW